MKKGLIVLMVVAALTAGCNKDGGKVLMKVGSEKITEKELQTEIDALPPQYKDYYSSVDGKKQLLEKLAEQKMLKQEALKKGYQKRDDYKSRLEIAKERELANIAVQAEIIEGVKVSEDDLKAQYQKNREQYKMDEQVKASHILIKVDATMSPAQKSAAKTEAEKLLKELLNGADFAEYAKKYSASPDGQQKGGDLGWFTHTTMVKPFADAAFAGEEGKIIPNIVETQYGYHIIKVTGKKPAGYQPIEEVKDQIEQTLLNDKRMQRYNEWMEELKKKYPKTEVSSLEPAKKDENGKEKK